MAKGKKERDRGMGAVGKRRNQRNWSKKQLTFCHRFRRLSEILSWRSHDHGRREMAQTMHRSSRDRKRWKEMPSKGGGGSKHRRRQIPLATSMRTCVRVQMPACHCLCCACLLLLPSCLPFICLNAPCRDSQSGQHSYLFIYFPFVYIWDIYTHTYLC
jgi:hypothetical protein